MTKADTAENDVDKLAEQVVEVMRRDRAEARAVQHEPEPVEVPPEPEQMQLWRRIIAMRELLVERIRDWQRFVDESLVEQGYSVEHIKLLRAKLSEMDNKIEKGTRWEASQKGLTYLQMQELAGTLEVERDAELLWWIEHYLKQKTAKEPHARLSKGTVKALLKRLLARDVDVDALELAANEARREEGTGLLGRKAKRMLQIAKRG